jgi:hypothetical protein
MQNTCYISLIIYVDAIDQPHCCYNVSIVAAISREYGPHTHKYILRSRLERNKHEQQPRTTLPTTKSSTITTSERFKQSLGECLKAGRQRYGASMGTWTITNTTFSKTGICPGNRHLSLDDRLLILLCSKFSSPTFQLLVGHQPKSFYVHRDVLKRECPYFAALSLSNCEAIVLDSPVDTVCAWRMCIEYMYRGSYRSLFKPSLSLFAKCYLDACVYVLARKLCIEGLQNEACTGVNRVLRLHMASKPCLMGSEVQRLVELVYKHTPDMDDDCEPDLGDTGGGSSDRMRLALAAYCGREIRFLRQSLEFLNVVKNWGEFAKDLVMAL